jgi:two-component system, LytTR family, sensor kinase
MTASEVIEQTEKLSHHHEPSDLQPIALIGNGCFSAAPGRSFRTAAAIFFIATLAGLFFAAQIYYSAASLERPVTWGQALYWGFGDWYEWALLSPAIFWLCRRFRFERSVWPKSPAVHLVAGLTFAGVHAVMCAAASVLQGAVVGPPVSFTASAQRLLAGRSHFNFAVYLLIVAAWHAWEYHRKYREREAEAADLSARLARAQLEALRMQLNPHFLFNTLNAISSLMLKDVISANKMISRLGELLRFALENKDQQEVPLRQELDFLQRYLEIERIRFGPRLNIAIETEPATLQAVVPNLILQPLVENAIHHAIEPAASAGQITLRSTLDHGKLLLEVVDNGRGLSFETEGPNQTRERVGLSNTQERLRKLYGSEQSFGLRQNLAGGVTASIVIPFRQEMSTC